MSYLFIFFSRKNYTKTYSSSILSALAYCFLCKVDDKTMTNSNDEASSLLLTATQHIGRHFWRAARASCMRKAAVAAAAATAAAAAAGMMSAATTALRH
jgi:hypothetical protein